MAKPCPKELFENKSSKTVAPTDFVVFIKSAAGVGQCGSGLARDDIDVVIPANRSVGSAGKPACVFKVS